MKLLGKNNHKQRCFLFLTLLHLCTLMHIYMSVDDVIPTTPPYPHVWPWSLTFSSGADSQQAMSADDVTERSSTGARDTRARAYEFFPNGVECCFSSDLERERIKETCVWIKTHSGHELSPRLERWRQCPLDATRLKADSVDSQHTNLYSARVPVLCPTFTTCCTFQFTVVRPVVTLRVCHCAAQRLKLRET